MIRNSILGILGFFLVTLFFSSCEKSNVGDCFTSTGPIEKQERSVGFFHSIRMYDNVNVILNQNGRRGIAIEAGSNLLDKITTELTTDSVLVIRNENRCNWVRSFDVPVNLYLDIAQINEIEYHSVGNISTTDTIRLDSLKISVWEGAGVIDLLLRTNYTWVDHHSGTADVVLDGISNSNIYYQLGAGRIDARNLMSGHVYMSNLSSNDMYIWATTKLVASIQGLGNIYYKGNPQIELQTSGQGDLIPLKE